MAIGRNEISDEENAGIHAEARRLISAGLPIGLELLLDKNDLVPNQLNDLFQYVAECVLGNHTEAAPKQQALVDCMIALLNTGAIDNTEFITFESNQTPLHWAASCGHLGIVRALCAMLPELQRSPFQNLQLNYCYNTHTTALAAAIKNRHYDIAAVLIEASANIFIADAHGDTPLALALDQFYERCVDRAKLKSLICLLCEHDAGCGQTLTQQQFEKLLRCLDPHQQYHFFGAQWRDNYNKKSDPLEAHGKKDVFNFTLGSVPEERFMQLIAAQLTQGQQAPAIIKELPKYRDNEQLKNNIYTILINQRNCLHALLTKQHDRCSTLGDEVQHKFESGNSEGIAVAGVTIVASLSAGAAGGGALYKTAGGSLTPIGSILGVILGGGAAFLLKRYVSRLARSYFKHKHPSEYQRCLKVLENIIAHTQDMEAANVTMLSADQIVELHKFEQQLACYNGKERLTEPLRAFAACLNEIINHLPDNEQLAEVAQQLSTGELVIKSARVPHTVINMDPSPAEPTSTTAQILSETTVKPINSAAEAIGLVKARCPVTLRLFFEKNKKLEKDAHLLNYLLIIAAQALAQPDVRPTPDIQIIDLLLQFGAEGAGVFTSFENNQTLLHAAAANGHIAIVKALIEGESRTDLRLDYRDISSRTPLIAAIANNYFEIALMLVEAGADVLVADDKQHSALHYALRKREDHNQDDNLDRLIGALNNDGASGGIAGEMMQYRKAEVPSLVSLCYQVLRQSNDGLADKKKFSRANVGDAIYEKFTQPSTDELINFALTCKQFSQLLERLKARIREHVRQRVERRINPAQINRMKYACSVCMLLFFVPYSLFIAHLAGIVDITVSRGSSIGLAIAFFMLGVFAQSVPRFSRHLFEFIENRRSADFTTIKSEINHGIKHLLATKVNITTAQRVKLAAFSAQINATNRPKNLLTLIAMVQKTITGITPDLSARLTEDAETFNAQMVQTHARLIARYDQDHQEKITHPDINMVRPPKTPDEDSTQQDQRQHGDSYMSGRGALWPGCIEEALFHDEPDDESELLLTPHNGSIKTR